ncbi:MAG: alpha/beta hydrolase [Acidobacteria bacterium]|nr:alpha/beta hydrolase [Acidobacteriota bacterium]
MMRLKLLPIVFALLLATAAFAQDEDAKAAPAKPKADIANGKYGPHERNVFDLWKPVSKKPTPLVVYIHGGGFVNGDKEKLSANLLERLLKNGIAVMAINYRLYPSVLFPEPYLDSARAIQFARSKAADFNIDKTKIAATGSAAGGLTSLWIGFHDDLADPKSTDPVLRESTRLSSMAVFSAQTTLEPSIVGPRVGAMTLKHGFYTGKFFGMNADEMTSPKGLATIKEASPIHFLTKDDPAVWAYYSVAQKPQTNETTVSDAIHHPNFGVVLKEEMDKLKLYCKLRHKDDGKTVNDDLVAFFLTNFKGK